MRSSSCEVLAFRDEKWEGKEDGLLELQSTFHDRVSDRDYVAIFLNIAPQSTPWPWLKINEHDKQLAQGWPILQRSKLLCRSFAIAHSLKFE